MPSSSRNPLSCCPLCGTTDIPVWHRTLRRTWQRCGFCLLVFVPATEHVSAAEEKAVYDQHENSLDDPGYHRFLSRIAEPVLARKPPGAQWRGIDMGCGPAPLLARMLAGGGIDMQVYDPYFAADSRVLLDRYDVVTASEVAEHFRAPGREFAQLFALLKPHGLLAVMTKRVQDLAAFARWHYILDPTHIAFYSEETFRWLAARYGAELEIVGADVVVFRAGADENAAMPEHLRP